MAFKQNATKWLSKKMPPQDTQYLISTPYKEVKCYPERNRILKYDFKQEPEQSRSQCLWNRRGVGVDNYRLCPTLLWSKGEQNQEYRSRLRKEFANLSRIRIGAKVILCVSNRNRSRSFNKEDNRLPTPNF